MSAEESKNKHRILFVYEGKMNMQGCDLSTWHMLKGLSQNGFEIDFISRGKIDLPNVNSIRTRILPVKPFSSLPSRYYNSMRRRYISYLGEKKLRSNADYSCCMAWSQSASRMFQHAKGLGIPRILHSGNFISPAPDKTTKPVSWPRIDSHYKYREYELASALFVISEPSRQSYIKAGIPAERLYCIGRGADLDTYYPPEKTPEKFVALFCGAIGHRKGALEVVKAWKQAALPNAELWMLGRVDASIKPELESLVDNSIKLLGYRDDIPDLMRQASIQFMLSNNDGPAKAMLEGAACGLATITTPESCYPTDNDNIGFLVQRNDRENIVSKLKLLYDDRPLLERMRHNAAAYAKANFSWERFYANIAQCVRTHIQTYRDTHK